MAELKNKYFILRHGHTNYHEHKPDIVYPRPDSSAVFLSNKGKAQIKKVAIKLKGKKIKVIYSSDFFRTRQTAKIVAEKLGVKIKFDKRLRDVNLGVYHGKPKKNFYDDFPRGSHKRFIIRPKKGENYRDLTKRIISFIKEIDKNHKNENILIVSHADPLMLLKGALMKLSEKNILKSRKKLFPGTGELKALN